MMVILVMNYMILIVIIILIIWVMTWSSWFDLTAFESSTTTKGNKAMVRKFYASSNQYEKDKYYWVMPIRRFGIDYEKIFYFVFVYRVCTKNQHFTLTTSVNPSCAGTVSKSNNRRRRISYDSGNKRCSWI